MSNFDNVYNSRVFNREVIQDIIKTCNNLILNKPESQSLEDAFKNIKNEMTGTFVDFYGPKYAKKVTDKIQNTQLVLVYQVLGQKNSIEMLVFQQREKYFEEKHGIKHWAMLNTYQQLMAYQADENSTLTDSTFEFLDKLGFSFEEYKNHPSVRIKIKSLIEDYLRDWDNLTFSDNPKINADYMKLYNYVNEYEETIEPLLREDHSNLSQNCPNSADFFYSLDGPLLSSYDPVLQELTLPHVSGDIYIQCQESLLSPDEIMAGFATQNDDENYYICFGIDMSDELLIHELNHVVDEGGYAKIINDPNYDSENYTPSNEVVNDEFAKLMYEARNKQGKAPLCKHPSEDSFYSVAFPGMTRFIKALLPQLKEARMSEHPVKTTKELIGDENFEKINSDINNIFELSLNDNLEEIETANNGLKNSTNKIAFRINTLKYLSEAVKDNAVELAKKLKKAGKTHLTKIAKSMYSLKDTLENLINVKDKSHKDEMERDE